MKKMNISLGGKELVLNFEAVYFYEYFQEYTGIDIFMESQRGEDGEMAKMIKTSTGYFKFITGLVAAGHHAECSILGGEQDFNYASIKHFIHSKSFKEVGDILDAYNVIMLKGISKNGEEKKKKSQLNQSLS